MSIFLFLKINAVPLPRHVSHFIFKNKSCISATPCLSFHFLTLMLQPCHAVSLILFLKIIITVHLPRHVSHFILKIIINLPLPRHVCHFSFKNNKYCHTMSLILVLKIIITVHLPHHVSHFSLENNNYCAPATPCLSFYF